MKLNLGCGDRYAEGWINVDHAGSPHRKDLEVDLTGPLPWDHMTLSYIYAGHLLEHLTREQCWSLLGQLRICVRPQGYLMVVGPDVLVAKAMAENGTLDVTMDSLIHGGHRWPGDEHKWECSQGGVVKLLLESGWGEINPLSISQVDPMWPVADRGPRWQFAVEARP